MRWKPVVVQSEDGGGGLVVTVGHPLVDAYLEFLRARARPNTIRAVAFDLKVFFTVVDKTPARVTSSDVMSFIARQRNGEGDRTIVQVSDFLEVNVEYSDDPTAVRSEGCSSFQWHQ